MSYTCTKRFVVNFIIIDGRDFWHANFGIWGVIKNNFLQYNIDNLNQIEMMNWYTNYKNMMKTHNFLNFTKC